MGLISPLGNCVDTFWEALRTGRSGVAPLASLSPEGLPICCAGEARDFTGVIDDFGRLQPDQKRTIRKGLKVMCREIQMGVAAAQRALADAGLQPGVFDPERTGVVYGSDYIMTMPDEFMEGVRSCIGEDRQFHFERWAEEGLPKVTPLWLLKYLPNMPASHIAIYNDLRGPNNSITLREASANLAVSEAYCTILRGGADTVIAGATGSRVHPLQIVHVALQEQVAECRGEPARCCRPFDLQRSGMVVGEGAGAIVLEELQTARARGARILAEMVGYGSSSVIERSSLARRGPALRNALQQALVSAGISPEQVGHIQAHGLSTRQCDIEEAWAIQEVFGQRPRPVPVTAAKSYFGNLGAGSGLVELIAGLRALQEGRLFPVLNYDTPDPECPVAAVRDLDTPAGSSLVNLSVTPQAQASAVLLRCAP